MPRLNKLNNTVSQCHVIQAMQPEKFPESFGTLVSKVKRIFGEHGTVYMTKCRCKPRCNAPKVTRLPDGRVRIEERPTREQSAKFAEKAFAEAPAAFAKLFKVKLR